MSLSSTDDYETDQLKLMTQTEEGNEKLRKINQNNEPRNHVTGPSNVLETALKNASIEFLACFSGMFEAGTAGKTDLYEN